MEHTYIIINSWWADYISLTSLIISIIALIYTVRAFWLKKWDKYRIPHSSFPSSSIESWNSYVSSLTIENLKDKPLIIFGIYLKFWNNIFLEIEEFEKKPHIIPAFEAHQFNYWSVIYYSAWTKKVNIEELFKNKKIKKKFIIETVNTRWFLMSKFFNNFATCIIHAYRLFLYEKSFWEDIDYIIDFDNWKTLIPVYLWKDTWRNGIKIPDNYLKNENSIKKYLLKLKTKWDINFKNIKIVEWKSMIEKRFNYKELSKNEEKVNNTANFFEYFIIGKLYTVFQNIKTRIINSKIYKYIKNKFKRIKSLLKK